MQGGQQQHILNASCNLIGVAFIILTGIRVTNNGPNTFADEICMAAAVILLGSSFFSYLSMRRGTAGDFNEKLADALLLSGILALFVSVFAFACDLF